MPRRRADIRKSDQGHWAGTLLNSYMRAAEIHPRQDITDLIRLQWLYRRYEFARYAFETERYRQRLRLYNGLRQDTRRRGSLPPKPEAPRPPRFDWA